MSEKFVLTYLDLELDQIVRKYFDSEIEAHKELKKVREDKRYMSEMLMSESKLDEFDYENDLFMEKHYGDDY